MPIPTPSDPQAAALLAHVLSQTQQNISFLAAQNYITQTEANELINRLSQGPATNASTNKFTSGVKSLALKLTPERASDSARRDVPPPPPRNNVQKARALWAYNENGSEPNDLSFSAGETVEIVEETNADWWTGKCRGKQGLFPSNHVEKLDSGSSIASPPPVTMPTTQTSNHRSIPPPPGPQQWGNEKAPAYKPPYDPLAPSQNPAPPAQAAPAEPPKKNKFGKYGNTMADSAARGVGFGAGAAIGGGIVRAIF